MKNIFKLASVFMAIALLVSVLLVSGMVVSAEDCDVTFTGTYKTGKYSSEDIPNLPKDTTVSAGTVVTLVIAYDGYYQPQKVTDWSTIATVAANDDAATMTNVDAPTGNSSHVELTFEFTVTEDTAVVVTSMQPNWKVPAVSMSTKTETTTAAETTVTAAETTATAAVTETTATAAETTVTATETETTETETTVTATETTATAVETTTNQPTAPTSAPSTETTTTATVTETQASVTETQTQTQAPATETQAPATETQAPATETQAPATETQASATETQTSASETATVTETTATEPVSLVEKVLVENNVGGSKKVNAGKTDAWFLVVNEIKFDIAKNGPIDPSKGEYYEITVTGRVNTGEADFHLGEGLDWNEYWGESGCITDVESTVTAKIPVAIPEAGIGDIYLADSGEDGHALFWSYAKISVFRVGKPEETTKKTEKTESTETAAQVEVYGDANGDGVVNMKDVLAARKYVAGMAVEIDLAASDVNADGAVNMKDILLIRKFVAGMVPSLGQFPGVN